MKKYAAAILMLLAAVLLLPSCASTGGADAQSAAGTLKIGWGKRSIAMPGPVPISGQFFLRVAQGTYTPVEASALVIENSKDAVIFVSCDVVSVNPKILMEVRKLLKKEQPGLPVEKLIISATHTHAGPSTGDNVIKYPNKIKVVPGSKVQKFIARQITDAVKDAWRSRAAGAVAYGYGFATTGHNRRTLYLEDMGKKLNLSPGIAVNGHCAMYGNTNKKEFAGYEAGTDTFINLLYTFDTKGKLTGAIINVPCPSQTSESAWAYNASFWHNVREKLAAKYGNVGVIAQSAAAGDLSPRQLHYKAAELRRYTLKYKDKIDAYVKNPMARPMPAGVTRIEVHPDSNEVVEIMRAEDIANRIVAAFDEVLSWAGKEKFTSPELVHKVKTVKLLRRTYPKVLADEERRKYNESLKEKFMTDGDAWEMLRHNSRLNSRRARMKRVSQRYDLQKTDPWILTDIHAVQIGNIAFASNRFELFLDFQHRIQGRSPFEQTFIVQLTTDPRGTGSYLATERGEFNKGYSATPHSNQVSYKGGQQLVNETVKLLQELGSTAIKKNKPVVSVPVVKKAPAAKDWQKALLLKDFCKINASGMQKAPIAVRMLHDGKYLYLKVDCGLAAKGDKIVIPKAWMPKRDSALYNYECIEFFIGRGTESYQIIFSPENMLCDLSHSQASKIRGFSWNCPGIKLQANANDSGWSAYLAVPLKELKFSAKGKTGEYKFNFYRTNYYAKASGQRVREVGSYLPAMDGIFKNTKNFATMKLAK